MQESFIIFRRTSAFQQVQQQEIEPTEKKIQREKKYKKK